MSIEIVKSGTFAEDTPMEGWCTDCGCHVKATLGDCRVRPEEIHERHKYVIDCPMVKGTYMWGLLIKYCRGILFMRRIQT